MWMRQPVASMGTCGIRISFRRFGTTATRAWLPGCLSVLVALGGCATNEQNGQLTGTALGTAIGAGLGKVFGKGKQGVMVGAGLGALSGYMIGGAIGRNLDERDRKIEAMATQQVLNQPYPAAVASSQGPQAAPATTAPAARSKRTRPRPKPAAPTSTQGSEGNGDAATAGSGSSSGPTQVWKSDHTDANGSVTVVAASTTPAGDECRTVNHIAYINGKEISQDQKYCRTPPSSQWNEA